MWEIVPAETHSTFFPFQNLDSWAICTAKYLFSGIGFLNIQPDNVQTADSQAIQASSFSQMGFLGWDFQWFSWINALTLFGAAIPVKFSNWTNRSHIRDKVVIALCCPRRPLEKDCSVEGREVCSTHHESECWTKNVRKEVRKDDRFDSQDQFLRLVMTFLSVFQLLSR